MVGRLRGGSGVHSPAGLWKPVGDPYPSLSILPSEASGRRPGGGAGNQLSRAQFRAHRPVTKSDADLVDRFLEATKHLSIREAAEAVGLGVIHFTTVQRLRDSNWKRLH